MLINRAINQNLLRFLVIVFFSILFILCLNTCFAFAAKQSNDSSRLDTVTLKLKWKHQFQFAGYYAALKKGFYQDAGLKVKIEEASDYTESTEAVLAGKADFGIGASDLVVNRVKGQPIVVLAAIFQHSPLVLLTKQDKGINQIHDIVGKRVMIEPHSDDLFAYLKDEGISKNQLIFYPHYFDITPLINNEVDAISAYLTDEIYLLKKQKISYNVFSPKSAGIDFYGDTLFTTEKQIREHPERVRKFLDASLRGWKYVFQNEQNMKDIIDLIYESYSKRHTREHLSYEAEKMRSFVIPEIVEIGYMYPGRWQHIA
jgi:ABC-type nitrate/sulfonate/bicarbonate transport system substrate-binding protein